jgi:hypothetical protein
MDPINILCYLIYIYDMYFIIFNMRVCVCVDIYTTSGCRKRVAPEFSTFHFFPFLPEVFVPGTSRAVQTHFVPSWYKEKWKKWKVENSGATRFLQPTVVSVFSFVSSFRSCFVLQRSLSRRQSHDESWCFSFFLLAFFHLFFSSEGA